MSPQGTAEHDTQLGDAVCVYSKILRHSRHRYLAPLCGFPWHRFLIHNESANDAHHDGHRVRIVLEALVELDELLVHKGVHGDLPFKLRLLLGCGQLPHEQQICAVQEIPLLCQLFNTVPVGNPITSCQLA